MSSCRCFFSKRVEAVILARKSPVVILTITSSAVPHRGYRLFAPLHRNVISGGETNKLYTRQRARAPFSRRVSRAAEEPRWAQLRVEPAFRLATRPGFLTRSRLAVFAEELWLVSSSQIATQRVEPRRGGQDDSPGRSVAEVPDECRPCTRWGGGAESWVQWRISQSRFSGDRMFSGTSRSSPYSAQVRS